MTRSLKIILFIGLFLPASMFSQRGFELGGWVGAAQYFGDLNNLYRINEPGLAGGFTGRFNFDNRLSARMQLNFLRVLGSDSKSTNAFDLRRNLSFYSNVFEFAPALELNFFTLKHGSRDHYITPYMYLGFSIFHFNPKAALNGQTYSLRDFGTEGQVPGQEYKLIANAWLLGGGVKVDLDAAWSINIDFGYRFTNTDYLDDVSGYYPDYNILRSNHGDIAVALSDKSLATKDQPKIGTTGTQRGDSRENDNFISLGINLVHYFGVLRCPDISTPRHK